VLADKLISVQADAEGFPLAMPNVFRFLIAFIAIALAAPPERVRAQDSSYIKIPNEDPEMTLAKAKARAALKVALPYRINSTEHIWTKDIERRDSKVSGVINNVPRDVKTVRLGQRIDIRNEQITDWMYWRGDKIVGNETLRPLLSACRRQMPLAGGLSWPTTKQRDQ
jgi:uncharacterized protein YegJ (DUF2314 family)